MKPAIPDYLSAMRFSNTPPGHYFSLYLSAWKDNFELDKNKKLNALKNMLVLPACSKKQMTAIRQRQIVLINSVSDNNYLMLEAISVSPMATGMGMEHPLENGFAFLNPYGLAYLPGSSIKGVLRCAAEELKHVDEQWTQDAIDNLFGPEAENDAEARRGALIFWDSIPEVSSMGIEIMTPHYSAYYQGKESPHDSGQPTPIPFLVVPADSKFRFIVTIKPQYLQSEINWKSLLQQAFEHAFDWLGFGAKTSVGYGAMQVDEKAGQVLKATLVMLHENHQREVEKREKTANLPDDAAWLVTQEIDLEQTDREQTLNLIDVFCKKYDSPSLQAWGILSEKMEGFWKGIMQNPDATRGKKKKAKFNPRPKQIAKWLLARKPNK